MNEQRGHWYLLTGAIIGIALGVFTAWVILPVQYVEAFPASLRADFKDEYRYMIAASYAVTGNLGRARARLALLEDANVIQALGDQAQRMQANNTAPEVIRSVTNLSQALQAEPVSLATPTSPQPSPTSIEESATPEVSTPVPATATVQLSTETPTPETIPALAVSATSSPTPPFTLVPRSTHTPTFTPGPPFTFVESTKFCKADQPALLQISLKDSSGQPAAGIELIITWAGGEEHFFTGLKPELGNGYADFVMSPNVEYALSLSNGNTRVTGLSAPLCTAEDGSGYFGGTHIEFKQP